MTRARLGGVVVLGLLAWPAAAAEPAGRPRARHLGLSPGVFPPGPLNAITDVAGVRVGHTTVVTGDRVRTGVTAIVPHPGNVFQEKVAAGVFVGNAFGKLAGSTQVEELGTLETSVVLTNTLGVGTAWDAVVAETLAQPGNEGVRSVNPVVGETNDGALNDIRGMHVTREHVRAALREASAGPVAEGSVGAGTGTVAFGWKGGIGTSSRVLPASQGGYTLGVLVQANYGGVLVMDGVPVGEEMGAHAFALHLESGARSGGFPQPSRPGFTPGRDALSMESPERSAPHSSMTGSCLIVVATDAPLEARDLRRLAVRAVFGLARTGSSFSHGSGDYAVAFSTSLESRTRHGETAPRPRTLLPSEATSPLFQAVLEATEEAVLNALLQATTTTGNGRTVEALPLDRLREILRRHGR